MESTTLQMMIMATALTSPPIFLTRTMKMTDELNLKSEAALACKKQMRPVVPSSAADALHYWQQHPEVTL